MIRKLFEKVKNLFKKLKKHKKYAQLSAVLYERKESVADKIYTHCKVERN